MSNLEVILGPPGTGKTYTLMAIVREALAAGVKPDRIGLVSFTKAAVQEARDRAEREFGLSAKDLPYWQTLHAMGRRLQGQAAPLLTASDMREFETVSGFRVSVEGDEDGLGGNVLDTRDQLIASVYRWCRARRETVDRGCMSWRGDQVDVEHVQRFAKQYEKFKASKGKTDFTDMLEGALGAASPDLDILVIDEAQDLSPLQIALAEQLMLAASRVVIAGDDDQAIMQFQGASAEWLMSLSKRGEVRILGQSRRVPRRAHAIASMVVDRVHQRIPKAYAPRDEEGWVKRVPYEMGPTDAVAALEDGSVAWLGRTKMQCQMAASRLFVACVPYIASKGGRNPLESPAKIKAARCAIRIAAGHRVDGDDVHAMLKQITEKGAGIKRGTKRAALDLQGDVGDFAAVGVGLWPLWQKLRSIDNPVSALDGLEPEEALYYRQVLDGGGELPENCVEVTTMHASKGREWDTVILSSDHNGAVERNLWGDPIDSDPEHRVAYVAVTRTKCGLLILDPHPGARFRYEYPIMLEATP